MQSTEPRSSITTYWAALLMEFVGNVETRNEYHKKNGRSFWNAESVADLVEICSAARSAGAAIHGGVTGSVLRRAQISARTLWLAERGFMISGAIPAPWMALRAELKRRGIPLKKYVMKSELKVSAVKVDGEPIGPVAIKIVTHKFVAEETKPIFASVNVQNSPEVQALLLALDIEIGVDGIPFTRDARGYKRKLSSLKLEKLIQQRSLARK